jgi:hypothetical protein
VLTADGVLAQALGNHEAAVERFTEAVARWEAFGNRLEQAYAMLGLGRSTHAVGGSTEALQAARVLFDAMGALAGVTECDRELSLPQR